MPRGARLTLGPCFSSPSQSPDTGGVLFSYVYPGHFLGCLERSFLSTVAPVW